MKILVVGHPLIVDSNRKFWSVFASENKAEVDMIVPSRWTSNLISHLSFRPNPLTDAGLKVLPLDPYFIGNGSIYFFPIFKVWKQLQSTRYDAIVVTQETWALSSLQLALLKTFSPNRTTKSYLSLCQNIKKKKLMFVWPLERFITSFYTKMLYCESSICEVLNWKGIRNPTHYFPFTYDEKLYLKRASEKTAVLRIGYLGRLTEEKGLRDLVEAFKLLKIPAELVIAGNGDLKEWLGTVPGCRYLGVIPHNQAHLFYENIDLLVLPSRTTPFWKEQFGRVIVEAIASGKPVVGSNSGAIPEVLGKIGLETVFRESDPADLAQKIELLHEEMKSNDWTQKMEQWRTRNYSLFSQKSQALSLGREIQGLLELKTPDVNTL